VLRENVSGALTALRKLPFVRSVDGGPTPDGYEFRVRGSGKVDLRPAIYDLARQNGWPVCELRRDVRTLETVFNELAIAAGRSDKDGKGGSDA
jgi:hypothetical protein